MRIAYVGLPLGALALAAAGFAPLTICLGHPTAPGARRVRRVLGRTALLLGRPDLEAQSVQSALASARPDVLLSWFWPLRIPASLLACAPRGAFGVHPSLLPRWRGPDPYFWAIYSGDAETGVTLHRLEAEYDTGAVIVQRRASVSPAEDALRLARRLDRLGLSLLVETARNLGAGLALEGRAQQDGDATQAPLPNDELLSIDWQRDAASIVRLVRAAAPYPGASAELGDQPVEIVEASSFPGPLPAALIAGDAVLVQDRVVVRAGQGAVMLNRVRTEGGSVLRGKDVAALFPQGIATI